MANWAADFIERNPELARWPVHRHRHALSFESPSGERHSFFVGAPAHWWDRADGWQEIDTALRRQPDGGFAAPGLPVRVYPDGTSICGGYAQRSGRVGVLSGARFYPLAELGPGRVDGDSLIREALGFRHVVRITERGLREELHVERDVSGDEADLLTVETQARGRLPSGYRFGRPVADVGGASLPLTQRGGWAGLPLLCARAGAVLDPDYACNSADGYIIGTSTTSSEHNTTSVLLSVGMYTSGEHWRSFVLFDTSAIPNDDPISKVNILLTCYAHANVADFDVDIVKQDWSAQNPIDMGNREAAFDACKAGTLDDAIMQNTAGIADDTTYTSGNLNTAWVSTTGITYYSLISANDKNDASYSQNQRVSYHSNDGTIAGYRPLLAVTHAALRYRRTLLGVGY